MKLESEFARQRLNSDEELVRECIEGNPDAWSELIRKYRNLVFSIPIKYGFSRDDATDIFQEVCLSLLQELPRLREPKTLAAWLIKVTSHRCFHSLAKQRRHERLGSMEFDNGPASLESTDDLIQELRREQVLREVLSESNGRCKHLVEMLFFTHPAVPYEKIAEALGIAKGSIGFIRMRCLQRLRQKLEERGFE
jgi:RNA polymerase sigma factor (sigma-70 family)